MKSYLMMRCKLFLKRVKLMDSLPFYPNNDLRTRSTELSRISRSLPDSRIISLIKDDNTSKNWISVKKAYLNLNWEIFDGLTNFPDLKFAFPISQRLREICQKCRFDQNHLMMIICCD